MDEASWRTCTDLKPMLEFLGRKATARKLRLLLCAGSRHTWTSQTPGRIRKAVDTVERYADGLASRKELLDARSRAWVAVSSLWYRTRAAMTDTRREHAALVAAAQATAVEAEGLLTRGVPALIEVALGGSWLPDLARDIFGSPSRPVSFSPTLLSWSGGTVVRLAEAAYEHRMLPAGTLDPARLAVLADALEEAGCDDAVILGHLRGPGPHVRGCFAVDALLGKG